MLALTAGSNWSTFLALLHNIPASILGSIISIADMASNKPNLNRKQGKEENKSSWPQTILLWLMDQVKTETEFTSWTVHHASSCSLTCPTPGRAPGSFPSYFEVYPWLLWYKTSMLTSLQQIESPAIFCISPPTSKISDSPATHQDRYLLKLNIDCGTVRITVESLLQGIEVNSNWFDVASNTILSKGRWWLVAITTYFSDLLRTSWRVPHNIEQSCAVWMHLQLLFSMA